MESRARLAGHAVHPMLITLPLGLLATAVIFDIIRAVGDEADFAVASFYMIAAGIIGGLLAALFGLIDWLAIPAGTRAKRIGALHGVGNVVVVALFAVSWLLRRSQDGHVPTGVALWLGIIAVLLALATAWAGGELVERLGVGVDEGANVDAPSSLSGPVRSAGPRRPMGS
ncbi:MAG: DUF2231 domain-containing protein [Mycobacteriales bacterium]